MSIDQPLKDILKKHAIDYTIVPSETLTINSGIILAIENYYPNNKESINLSIALSYSHDTLEQKCWLSVKKISNREDRPKYYPKYGEFSYNKICYYPYSINTTDYGLERVIKLCDGLYQYAKEES